MLFSDANVGVPAGFAEVVQIVVVAQQFGVGERRPIAVAQRLAEGVHEARDDRPYDGENPKQLYGLPRNVQDQENGCGRQGRSEPEQDG